MDASLEGVMLSLQMVVGEWLLTTVCAKPIVCLHLRILTVLVLQGYYYGKQCWLTCLDYVYQLGYRLYCLVADVLCGLKQ